VGSPLRGLPLTRFPGRGRGGRASGRLLRPPRPTPRRSVRLRLPRLPGTPCRPFPLRGRMRLYPAEWTRWRPRAGTEARPVVPFPEAGAVAARVPARYGAPRGPRAACVRALAPRRTGWGTPTPSAPGGHRWSRPPAEGCGRRLGRTAPSPAARSGRPASGESRSTVGVREHGTHARRDRGTRRQGAAPAAHPCTDGIQLRASTPRGLFFPPRSGRQKINR